MEYYFSYAFNLNSKNLLDRGLKFYSKTAAKLLNYKLVFTKPDMITQGIGYANVIPDSECEVEGALYTLETEVLMKLDLLAGVPDTVLRKVVQVVTSDNKIVSAYIYILKTGLERKGLFPTRLFIGQMLAGYDVLSPKYMHKISLLKTFDEKADCLLFTYGTLRFGRGNNKNYLTAARLVEQNKRIKGYEMRRLHQFFPFAFLNENTEITGDIFEIDKATLIHLDMLEGIETGSYIRFYDYRYQFFIYLNIYDNPENYPKVASGDWIAFLEERKVQHP